jgi:hypothetical protein
MVTFLGGVRDTAGTHGFIPVGPDDVVAVDITRGAVLWRRDGIGRPIAATASRLVTLVREGEQFLLRIFAVADGRDIATAQDFGMPRWAAQIDTSSDAVVVDAVETDEGIHIEWRIRRPYRGGAPPRRDVAEQVNDEMRGALVLDPDTARTNAAPSARARNAAFATQAAIGEPHVSPDPGVVALDRIGDRMFALKVRSVDRKSVVTLEARNAKDGSTVWEATLVERASEGPAPLRR